MVDEWMPIWARALPAKAEPTEFPAEARRDLLPGATTCEQVVGCQWDALRPDSARVGLVDNHGEGFPVGLPVPEGRWVPDGSGLGRAVGSGRYLRDT